MLKEIAKTKTNKTAIFDEVEVGQVKTKITLTNAQKNLVETIKKHGGEFNFSDCSEFGDRRSINALVKKGVLSYRKKVNGAYSVVLNDVTVEVENNDNENEGMTAEQFAAICKDIFGYGYQSHLSRIMGVNNATFGKWIQGKLKIPQYAIALVMTFEHCKDIGAPLPDFAEK